MEAEINIKSDNYIQLADDDILRLGIKDAEGNDTGNYLEFNLADIELPLIYQEIIEEDKKNRLDTRNKIAIIERKQDHKGKKLMSANEEAKIKVMIEFYKKEKEIYDKFLGEGGVDKLLNGRKLSWTTLDEIDEIIEKYIMPKLEIKGDRIKEKIMKKYSNKTEEVDVLE
jgi:hypothetical protein